MWDHVELGSVDAAGVHATECRLSDSVCQVCWPGRCVSVYLEVGHVLLV
jgi:hypothetical protein